VTIPSSSIYWKRRHEIWKERLDSALENGLIIDVAQVLWSGDCPEWESHSWMMPDDPHYLRLAAEMMVPGST
jgi:hypothetical protein